MSLMKIQVYILILSMKKRMTTNESFVAIHICQIFRSVISPFWLQAS